MANDRPEQSLPSSSFDERNLPAPAPSPSDYIEAIISILHRMRDGESTNGYGCMTCYMHDLLGNLNNPEPLDTLVQSCVIEHFADFHTSKNTIYREKADYFIRHLLHLMVAETATGFLDERASIILKLCKFLRSKVSCEDSLYVLSLRYLRDLAEKGNYMLNDKYKTFHLKDQILAIFEDLVERLLLDLHRSFNSPSTKETTDSLVSDFRDLKAFLRLLYRAIQEKEKQEEMEKKEQEEEEEKTKEKEKKEQKKEKEKEKIKEKGNKKLGEEKKKEKEPAPISSQRDEYATEKKSLRFICFNLLDNIAGLLDKVQLSLTKEGKINEEKVQPGWFIYLAILEEMNFISRICPRRFRLVLNNAKLPLRALIVRFAKRTDGHDYQWLLEHKNVTDSDSRMHLAMLMIPRVIESIDAELMKTLARWFQDLDTDQFGVFEHKSLTDPQVLHELLCKSCKIIFNPKNPLFVAHPGDPPSFDINPEFNPEPSHYESVEFAGKVIALAVIHKVRIGVALDGVFLSQLANSSSYYRCNKDVLVSFFAQGFASVFGVSFKELLSFKGLQYEDINQVLCRPSTSSVLSNSKRKKEIRIDPPLSHGKEVKKPERNFRNWQRGSMLGSGSFGEVYKGTADPNGFLFAAKKVPLEDTQKVSSIEHTVGSLRQLHHENIVEYFGTKKEEANLYIFHEFVSGGSLDKVHKELILDDARVSCYTQQILKGLKYLHEQNVIHGDIKCANILLNDKGVVQIADFGLAKVIDSENLHKSSRAIPAWSAPEVIDSTRQGGYGLEADIWSLGCTVLEMLSGEYPYCHLEPWTIWYWIGEGIPPDVPDFLSDTSRDFIEKCLQIDPKARPTAAQLLQHTFVKEVKAISSTCKQNEKNMS
ncbi:hypothetical protein JCGZ_00316 [Jatropha curcas]|uniref:mitogen-activated protein kinase kinase kinase n=1 Tax=Jatropha curcas TaxID=180498 RepID=A0A067LEK2_JATCU|nr:hypothetical protein JCGZ_00316 [Jatropha curcas]